MIHRFTRWSVLAVLVIPAISLAAPLQGINDILTAILGLVRLAIPIAWGAAFLAFFYGIAKFIFAAGNEKAIADGKRIMIWGVIAIFVMVSLSGIIKFLGDSVGIDTPSSLQGGSGR